MATQDILGTNSKLSNVRNFDDVLTRHGDKKATQVTLKVASMVDCDEVRYADGHCVPSQDLCGCNFYVKAGRAPTYLQMMVCGEDGVTLSIIKDGKVAKGICNPFQLQKGLTYAQIAGAVARTLATLRTDVGLA